LHSHVSKPYYIDTDCSERRPDSSSGEVKRKAGLTLKWNAAPTFQKINTT